MVILLINQFCKSFLQPGALKLIINLLIFWLPAFMSFQYTNPE